ncbi:MAG: hypothetical protein ACRELT_00495 [Longimicrobiales bacterium]
MKYAFALALTVAVASGASAQHLHRRADAVPVDEAGASRFIEDARLGTADYRDRRAAIADGYRRLGPAFPGMGEHWVHPGLIVNGRFDASTPSVLCYADSAGVPTLVGVAYAVAVRPGESPPPAPAGDDVWHEHSDAVDDETLLLVHPAAHEGDASQPRLAMFHAWIWLDNPAGAFAQNNWALPFVQLGLSAPPDVTPAAAHAASLLTVGEPYYMQLLDVLARPEPAERLAFQRAVANAAAGVRAWHASIESSPIGPRDVVALERIWTDLWQALDAAAGDATRVRLLEYAGRPERMMR